jgi:hypothetical protein
MLFTRYSGNDTDTLQFSQPGPPFLVHFQSPDGKPIRDSNVHVAVDGVIDDMRFLDQILSAGGDPQSGPDGVLRVAGLPSRGLLTIFPVGRPDLAAVRSLPILDEITFTLPFPEVGKRSP